MNLATITHKITLSTTDHNLVGDIKVRQADDETIVLDAKILEHGLVKNFDGLKPFFCLMAREITGQGVSEEPVTVYDETKGTLKYTLSANAMQMVGRNEAYFSFRKELTNGSWAEQFSTRSFFYTVEKSIYTQPFKDSNYWFTFKELYRLFNDYIESGKLTWEDFMDTESDLWKNFINQNREIIESVDPGGQVLTELITARGGATTLGERLDSDKAEVTAQLAQSAKDIKVINNNLRKGFVAHRGLQSVAPENSLKSISEAGRKGFAMCEIDAQLTSDGYWILMHDSYVDRTTDGTGVVSSMTLAQIQSLKIDTPSRQIDTDEIIRVPLLEEVLAECALYGMGVTIDGQKYQVNTANLNNLINLLKKYGLLEKSAFYMPTIENRLVASQFPEITILYTTLVSNIENVLAEVSNYDNPILIGFQSADATEMAIKRCYEEGYGVYIWNAHEFRTAYQWLNKGAQYVETNYVIPGGEF